MPDEPPVVTFMDNPHAPSLFCDGAVGFFVFNGVISITLEAARVDHSKNPGLVNRVVVARLNMSIPGAQALALGL